ncbi:hypothetical protein [Streptomyces viridosporus]|uniref:hypothetical protein n=1 Tax=Streptomyces viridosporus TaxID=67581 RepID=UPI0036FC5062
MTGESTNGFRHPGQNALSRKPFGLSCRSSGFRQTAGGRAGPWEESLYLYDDGGSEPDESVAGSAKMPLDPGRILPVLDHGPASVTELRRALRGARWSAHLDDLDVPWDEDDGSSLPGVHDADPATGPGGF